MTLADHFLRKYHQADTLAIEITADAIRSVRCTSMDGVIITCTDGSKLIHRDDGYFVDNSGYERYIHGKGNVVVGS